MKFDFNLKNGIRCQKGEKAITFSQNGEQIFYYSVPPKISKKVAQEDCKSFLVAKDLLKTEPSMTQYE